MNEATGQTGLMNIMLTIIGITIVLLAGSIAYSKAFRVKNRITDAIEKNGGYNGVTKSLIEETLKNIGYKTIDPKEYLSYCPTNKFKGSDAEEPFYELVTNNYPGYLYCVYSKDYGEGVYSYKVMAFMYFDLPVISRYILIPVTGETKIIYPNGNYKTVE